MDRIGFIGLGNMGRPMATNLCRKGFSLVVCDIQPGPVQVLEEAGARSAVDCGAVAAGSDIVFTMLPDSATVANVVSGADGVLAHLAKGSVIVDMSTIDPLVTDRLAAPNEDATLDALRPAIEAALKRARPGRAATVERVIHAAGEGVLAMGGALLDAAGGMVGSIAVTRHASIAEAEAFWAEDPYVTQGVWGETHRFQTRFAPLPYALYRLEVG